MISKTKIEKRLKQKKNPELVETLIKLKKKNPTIAKLFARPVKKQLRVNLFQIEKKAGNIKNILVPGKVLGSGNLTKKIKVVAFGFSDSAKEKIKKSGGDVVLVSQEILKNPELKNFEVLK